MLVGDRVVVQGMPARILALENIGGIDYAQVLCDVPQVRWIPVSALDGSAAQQQRPASIRPGHGVQPPPSPDSK